MSTTAPPSSPSTPLSFDLEAYIGRYPTQSETRLQRLVFIYRKAIAENDSELAQQAKNLASEQIRATSNTKRYKELFVEQQQDPAWISQVEQESMALQEALEGRLSAAQAHLNKEAIRMAYLAFCDFYRPRGDLREAMRAALRSRDYCTNRNQTAHVCLLIMELAMDMQNYSQVHDYVAKAEHSIIPGDISFPVKLKVASGLAYLAEGRFEPSAEALTSLGIVDDLGNLCAPEDVALYGGLLGLATLTRSRLLTVMDSPLLELVPKIRECLSMYCRAEYRGAIDILVELQPLLALDMHLAPHVSQLMQNIREKALVDYLRPYKRVSLSSMADNFSIPVSELITTLATLIGSGKIVGSRINCASQTLEKSKSVPRTNIVSLQDRVLNDSYACLIRLACIQFDLIVDRQQMSSPAEYSASSEDDDDNDDQVMQQIVEPPDDYY